MQKRKQSDQENLIFQVICHSGHKSNRALAREIYSSLQAAKEEAGEEDAVDFAEWIFKFGYFKGNNDQREMWFRFDGELVVGSTAELFTEYKTSKQ